MSVKQFKFVSPGIFINEIDRSNHPATPGAVGPVIIGRTKRGPAFRPTKIESFSDYLEVFGEPVPGAQGDDAWRSGVPHGPTYASYAAQAYLRNNGPVTVVRTLGSQADDATTGLAGWMMGESSSPGSASGSGGTYGLFVFPSASCSDISNWYLGRHLVLRRGRHCPFRQLLEAKRSGTTSLVGHLFASTQTAMETLLLWF